MRLSQTVKFADAIRDEQGSIVISMTATILAVVSIIAFAVDVGHFRSEQRVTQNAADVAAVAAALQIRGCGGAPNCEAMQTAATSALAENGLTVTSVLSQCSGTPGSGVTLMLNNPSCAAQNDPNTGNNNYVEAIVSEQVPTYFARIIGINSTTVSARAEAMRGNGPCIYALDSSGAAIIIVAGVLVKANCGVVDESTSSNALACVVGIGLYAPSVNISGNAQGLLCALNSVVHTNVPAPLPADPLSYLPAPTNANASCGTSTGSPYTGSSGPVNVVLGGNVVFNPGVYCGGISLTAALGSNITFNPGTYILRDQAGFLGLPSGGLNMTLSALSSITGNGVTFYNEGPSVGFNIAEPLSGGGILSLNSLNLTAPSTGIYAGVLFFQAHGVTAPGTFLASVSGGGNLQGGVYEPSASVNYAVNALSSSYNFLVAKDINFVAAVGSSFANNYSSLSGGSPLDGENVSLIQ
jgi:Flp pilus assembly protein TadG